MAATALLTPTNIATSKASTGTGVTVTWSDTNSTANVARYEVTFLAKDTLAVYSPPNNTVAGGTFTATITPATGDPTQTDLLSGYIARVIAKAQPNQSNFTDSAPGLQIYWAADLSVIIQVGSQSFTLTKSSSLSGVYRLPVSRDAPVTITLADIQSFADAVGVGAGNVPTKWPDGSEITGSLNLYKLAVDTDRKLFALDIAFTLDFAVVPGLTIKEVGLSVVRTNGVNAL